MKYVAIMIEVQELGHRVHDIVDSGVCAIRAAIQYAMTNHGMLNSAYAGKQFKSNILTILVQTQKALEVRSVDFSEFNRRLAEHVDDFEINPRPPDVWLFGMMELCSQVMDNLIGEANTIHRNARPKWDPNYMEWKLLHLAAHCILALESCE